jgi:hypothetical protein
VFANAPWAVALVAATLLGMCAAMSARAVRVPPAAADRLVAELRLAQLAGTLLAFTAATYVGLAVAQPAVPGTGLDVAIAFGFGILAATASWWDPRTALTTLAAAFVGHALVDLGHRPGWLPAVVPRWYVVGCAVHNLATAALCYLPILRR